MTERRERIERIRWRNLRRERKRRKSIKRRRKIVWCENREEVMRMIL